MVPNFALRCTWRRAGGILVGMKKLYRSNTNKKIAGVCGGLGEYFNVDPTVVRVGFVLLALPGGLPGILPYILLTVVIPHKP